MELKYWYEKGIKYFENKNWDEAYLTFHKIFSSAKHYQIVYPYLAYTAMKTQQFNEINYFLEYPFKNFIVTNIDDFEATLNIEYWRELEVEVKRNDVILSNLSQFILSVSCTTFENKLSKILYFIPRNDLEKFWLNISVFNIAKDFHKCQEYDIKLENKQDFYFKSIAIYPETALPYYLYMHYISGTPAMDFEPLDKAINLNPNYLEAYRMRGWLNWQEDDYEEAIKDYSVYIDNWLINADILHPLEIRALSYTKLNKDFEAIMDYNAILDIEPSENRFLILRANSKLRFNDRKGAIHDLTQAIINNFENFRCYCKRADIKVELGDYSSAMDDYTTAINLNKNYITAYKRRSNLYKLTNDLDNAVLDNLKAQEIINDKKAIY